MCYNIRMGLIADIFVTCKPTEERAQLTRRSLLSLLENTSRDQFRLTLCVDGHGYDWNSIAALDAAGSPDYVITSCENEGLGPTINRALAHIRSIGDWHSDPLVGNPTRIPPYIVMCQDDLLYTKDWLPILASRYRAYGLQYRLGFASGVECIEHPIKQVLTSRPDGSPEIVLKDWIRASQMMATREYWQSLIPIPAFDPETGRLRAKPNNGMGSGVDWWLIRNHPNSVCKSGRTNLVMPGLVQHMGYDKSTWLKRELPESDSDKERIRNG